MMFYSDDPGRDFDRWDMEQERRRARLPVCECCQKTINDDDYYDINNELLCEECVKDKYRRYTADLLEID